MLKVALNTIPTQQGIYFFYFSIVTINVTLITINILLWHALALSCVVITLVESQLLYITIISLEVIFMFPHAKLISDLIQHCCLRCHLWRHWLTNSLRSARSWVFAMLNFLWLSFHSYALAHQSTTLYLHDLSTIVVFLILPCHEYSWNTAHLMLSNNKSINQ